MKGRKVKNSEIGTSQFDDQKELVEMVWTCWTKRW